MSGLLAVNSTVKKTLILSDLYPSQVHDPPSDPHEVLRAASWLTEEQLTMLSPSILKKHPNSYTYSKRLAEALVRESYPQLPACVVRPSIGEIIKCPVRV